VSTSLARAEVTHLGLDVHRDTISVAVLEPGSSEPVCDKIFHDEDSVRRLIDRVTGGVTGRRFVACYEAGPTGYELARLLQRLGVRCDVVAPSLIPRSPGERIKTDRRDARKLVLLHRTGHLAKIRVPTPAEEGVRDLCRTRADLMMDQRRARQRLTAFLLRHGIVYRTGKTWTGVHGIWLDSLRFEDAAMQRTFDHYRSMVSIRDTEIAAVDADLQTWFTHPLFADTIARLGAYRGIDHLGALTIACEVCDWKRFSTAGAFMSFTGLVPREHSSGGRTKRGGITKAGNPVVRSQLVESAWAYQFTPRVSVGIAKRHADLDPATIARAWKAQLDLTRAWRRLAARKDNKKVVAAAVARRLAGFVWAEMTTT
jgi:transposase